jgi:hypothetical protein
MHTALTFSGFKRMWRKNEYGQMYQIWKEVKLRCRIHQRQKKIDGILKMEANIQKGMAYSSGIRTEGNEVVG